ncbi:MAG: carbamoyltransferase [Candidatus Peribacteraceae bacterium]|nr:carbamoyltransferase [Candidatus Peribacteraceae bacterium]MDD5075400.1 carbamoyltransferase [Candidatus Peribacteraceae bacterium]
MSSEQRKPCYILGLSCFYHDSAAVLLKDGEVVFAAQEERFTRKKHDEALPVRAVTRALRSAGITMRDIDAVVFYEKPLLKFFDRILSTVIAVWPRGFLMFHRAMHEWLQKKLWIPQIIRKELEYDGPVLFTTHHESHAASAYYPSGFPDAAIVTVDGVGEWATTTIGLGKGTEMTLKEELHFPHSLGLLYSAITYYLGFRVNSAEYKVMGLAPYGKPAYLDRMRSLMDLKEDGSFRLDMRFFTYEYGSTMTGKALERLFGQPRRKPEGPLTQFHKDIARSLQDLTNEVMLRIVRHAKETCPSENLCLAGGVALNCVANGVIRRSGLFKHIFIQPAAGDAGGALGAALAVWHRRFGGKRMDGFPHVFLGTEYAQEAIESFLKERGLPYETLTDAALPETVANLLEGENVIGWFQGRMEFGPRSLGNRSILADARNPDNWRKVNLKIKFRESFRPFAPTVLEERVSDYFDLREASPFMLLVADVLPHRRSEIPAVTHVDGSARIQTIRRDQNPRYEDLLKAFERKTGCAVIINTSFNVRGEPIVESPADAVNCFLHTEMDCLVLGNCLLKKSAMPDVRTGGQERYLGQFALD